jgi:oxygen-independent coproporphyrinogen-3 oxidase
MYSLPNQKREELLTTLDKVCALNPEHISSYCLKIEEKTPFGKIKDKLILPCEDDEYEMYISMCELLEKNGFYAELFNSQFPK